MNEPESNPWREKTKSLPRELQPARDLWPEIRAQIEAPTAASAARASASASASASTSRSRSTITRWTDWRLRLALAAAAVAIVATSATLFFRRNVPAAGGWSVTTLAGTPRLNSAPLAGEGTWRKGQWLETDSTSSAKFAVGNIGQVRIEPNSRLRLLGVSENDHRLELARGSLSAVIWAPPRLFFVETPSATAVDLGCAYTLTVDDNGEGTLRVTSGYVALEHGKRESLIPAGLMCHTRVGAGPGTPFSVTTAAALRAALQRFDFAAGGEVALEDVVRESKTGDEITLWHLLSRANDRQRGSVYDKLAALRAPPAGVTRAGILAGEKSMLENWGRELGLGAL
jgi:predicted RNA-binding protein